ncbi:GDSL esterase/lipase [Cardamine amara subsp. amara]|uniref:GDSL esterase/lipase n=1 Tax=Cardamine amara subsp. amara TaxID=228776 RepID=A0ABD1BD78_CARAN
MNFIMISKMLLALFSSICLVYVGSAQQTNANSTVTALFAFGDSILDTGNNNLLLTVTKVNFFPYGRDFVGGRPTGRFGNGRVFSDMISEGLGLKSLLPAFRDPFLSNNDLPTGVCFASGGSGLDQLTASIQGVIWVSDQVKDFQNYITKLNGVVGDQGKANTIISNAVYLISAGNNDIAITYFSTINRRFQYTVPGYTDLLVTWTRDLIKSLYDMGARKFAVMGTLPLGCLPGARTLIGNVMCEFFTNQAADMFNKKLSAEMDNLGASFPGAKFMYIDMYNPLIGLINNPMASGFLDGRDGCCCTPTSIIPCLDASRYVFWDIAHPTEKSYKTITPSIIEEIKQKLA